MRQGSLTRSFSGAQLPHARFTASRRPCRHVTRMGLFGLGVPELAVIVGITALVFGEYTSILLCGMYSSRKVLKIEWS